MLFVIVARKCGRGLDHCIDASTGIDLTWLCHATSFLSPPLSLYSFTLLLASFLPVSSFSLCVSTLVFTFHSAIVRVCPACCVCLSVTFFDSLPSFSHSPPQLSTISRQLFFSSSISLHLLPLLLFRVCASVGRARKPPATCPLPPTSSNSPSPTSLPFLTFLHYYTVPTIIRTGSYCSHAILITSSNCSLYCCIFTRLHSFDSALM